MRTFITLLLLPLLAISQLTAQQQIENSNFELWEQTPGTSASIYETPAPAGSVWSNANEAMALYFGSAICKKTDDAHSGDYAALLVTNETTIIGTTILASGNLFLGQFDFNLGFISNPEKMKHFGVPFSGKPLALSGWYKYLPVDGDSCQVYSILTSWNSAENQQDTVAVTSFTHEMMLETVSQYSSFSLPYTYLMSNQTPDSIQLVIASSKAGAQLMGSDGSAFYIDDIVLSYENGISENSRSSNCLVYPNPVVDQVSFDFEKTIEGQLKIYNCVGKVVAEIKVNGSSAAVNMSSYSNGCYFYRVEGSRENSCSGRFIKTK